MESKQLQRSGCNALATSLNFQELQKVFSQTSISKFEEVIKSDLPTLFDLSAAYGEQVTKIWLFDQLLDYATFVNAGKSFNKEQLNETVDLILMAYSNMNMADFKLFFKKCKLGIYGKLFDVLDGQILLGWLLDYKNERIQSAEHLSIVEASMFKKKELEPAEPIQVDQPGYSQEYVDAIKALLDANKSKVNTAYQNEKKNDPESANAARQNIEQRWMKQFNNLARGTKFRCYQIESPIRMIQVGKLKPMSITEYLTYKLSKSK